MLHPTKKWVLKLSVAMLVLVIVLANPTSEVSSQSCSPKSNSSDPRGGYCDTWGWWIPGYITNQTWMTAMPNHASGKMVFYAPGAMEATAEYRGLSLENYVDGVALMSPIDIGKTVWIRIDGKWWGPFLSVDCARKGDMYPIIVYRGEVVEVGFEFAEQIGMAEKLDDHGGYKALEWFKDVEIYVAKDRLEKELPDLSESTPVYYPEWFVENLRFATRWEQGIIDMGGYRWKLKNHDIYWFDEDYWHPNSLKDSLGGRVVNICMV